MPVASGRSAVLGFGRQTAEGTALTSPKYEIPMGDGGWAGPERTVEDLPWTQDSQDPLGAYVSLIAGVLDAPLPILPVSCVSLLQGVLGTRTTTGAGPYTHALTPADSLPFLTFFYQQPGGNYWITPDVKVGSAELSWSPGSPLELSVNGRGKASTRSGTKWTAATLVEGVNPFFTYIGATMNIDHSATPATTRVRNLRSGSVTINRNLDPIQTDAISDQYLAEQSREISVSLDDVVFENNDWINALMTGTTTGTTVSGVVVYGSADFTFIGSDQAAAATRSLRITLPNVHWAIDQIPTSDPGGAPASYTLTGRVYKPTAGASITVTVVNSDAGTNY